MWEANVEFHLIDGSIVCLSGLLLRLMVVLADNSDFNLTCYSNYEIEEICIFLKHKWCCVGESEKRIGLTVSVFLTFNFISIVVRWNSDMP